MDVRCDIRLPLPSCKLKRHLIEFIWRDGIYIIIIIIIEGLSLLQSIPPTMADKQTQAQKRRGSRSRKLLGAKAKTTG